MGSEVKEKARRVDFEGQEKYHYSEYFLLRSRYDSLDTHESQLPSTNITFPTIPIAILPHLL